MPSVKFVYDGVQICIQITAWSLAKSTVSFYKLLILMQEVWTGNPFKGFGMTLGSTFSQHSPIKELILTILYKWCSRSLRACWVDGFYVWVELVELTQRWIRDSEGVLSVCFVLMGLLNWTRGILYLTQCKPCVTYLITFWFHWKLQIAPPLEWIGWKFLISLQVLYGCTLSIERSIVLFSWWLSEIL